MLKPLPSLLLALSAVLLCQQAQALTFQTRLERIEWQVEGDQFECRLSQPIADFGSGEFVRRAAMEREVVVIEGMDEILRELRYQGNNLNQLTVMARQGRITQVNYEPFMEVYRGIWQTLNSLLSHAV